MMNLLYVTVKALLNPHVKDSLIRCVFELRAMAEEGYCPELASCACCARDEVPENDCFFSGASRYSVRFLRKGQRDAVRISGAALYAMRYIVSAPMGKLYTFTVSEEVLAELERIVHRYVDRNTDRKFKSLEILEIMK